MKTKIFPYHQKPSMLAVTCVCTLIWWSIPDYVHPCVLRFFQISDYVWITHGLECAITLIIGLTISLAIWSIGLVIWEHVSPKFKSGKKGFGLIDAIVIVAILSILAGILLHHFGPDREKIPLNQNAEKAEKGGE